MLLRAALRSPRPFHAALLASVSALALLTAGAPVRALPFASAGGGGSASAAAAAAAAAIANVQQAQQATQQSMSSLLRASQAVAAMQQAQATARALALKTSSNVPNGLLPGGLVPDSGLNASGIAAPVTSMDRREYAGANLRQWPDAGDGSSRRSRRPSLIGRVSTLAKTRRFISTRARAIHRRAIAGSCSTGCRTRPECRARSSARSRPKAPSM